MPQLNRSSKLNHALNRSLPLGWPTGGVKVGERRKKKKVDVTQGLQVVNPNAAAVDIGAAEHWVALPPNRAEKTVRCFGCTTAELKELADWLQEHGVDTVVMEATGDYWVALYDLLEERKLRPVVVNPRYAKNMSGKKGDIPDCQWMQKLHTFGLFANSFRPVETIRVWRAYLRQRENLVISAGQAIQHMQKALTEMNVQLANVISDVSGETGLRIIDAILAGERDTEKLADLRDRRIRASARRIAQALEGTWKKEHLFTLEQARLTYDHYQEQIAQCDERIAQHVREMESRVTKTSGEPSEAAEPSDTKKKKGAPGSFDLSAELKRVAGVDLTQVDGMGALTVQIVLSEVGVDMSYWATDKHFASWLGLCPDHRISGGKILSRHTRPVVSRARHAFRMAAYSLERSLSWLGAKYRRLKKKLGAPKAITAMAHHLARLVYRLLKNGESYVDKGMEVYEAKYQAQRRQWLEKQAKDLNLRLVPA
jgi:transposase